LLEERTADHQERGGHRQGEKLMKILRSLVMAATLIAASGAAHAQSWPNGPLRLIIPFPAAGQTDLLGRAFADALRTAAGVPVVVENKTGAGGNVGAAVAAQAAGDGQTLLIVTPGILSINRWLYASTGFDPDKDFKMVGIVGLMPSGVAVNPRLNVSDLKQLVELMKKRSDVRTASPGVGTTGHLMSELLKTEAGVKSIHVPYRGNGPALQALLAGEVDVLIDGIPAMITQHTKGAIKLVAVTSPERMKQLPDVPTAAEQGFGAITNEAWYGVVVPASTPDDVTARIYASVQIAMKDAKLLERFDTLGIRPQTIDGTRMSAIAKEESVRWKEAVRQSGAKLD
jgi:tripartite-type tricarboxylate transporter receptor subunit TctC